MKTLELFCGTKSFSKAMILHGHHTHTIDNDPQHNPDVCIDIMEYHPNEYYDFVWASPPCTTFSVASMGHHWTKPYGTPKTDECVMGMKILDKTIEIISIINPKYWCIENPRGMMRKVIEPIFNQHGMTDYHRTTITYCQYGDTRMKPTDIWTNIPGWFGKRCRNGDTCHVKAPRGSRTGTQGIKGNIERGRIPDKLFIEILKHIGE